MELVTGVLYYKIASYLNIEQVCVLELFSTTVQAKLRGNTSAFCY